ncbi:MAG: hypothetical protein V3U75_11040 [Methylococcaceae bacterium]
MRPSKVLQTHREQIRSVVMAHRAINGHVLGSVVHSEDIDESDLDLLVDSTPETSLMVIGAIRNLEIIGGACRIILRQIFLRKWR